MIFIELGKVFGICEKIWEHQIWCFGWAYSPLWIRCHA